MALTAAQLSYIRDNSGDDQIDSASAYEVADATIQAIYDDTTTGNSDLDRTVVYVIRRRLGKAARYVSLSGEFGNAQHNQKFEQLKQLLELWEGIAGLGGKGVLTTGILDLELDEPCPDGMDCS